MNRARTNRVVGLRVLVMLSLIFALGAVSAGCGVNLCGVYNCDTFPGMADLDGRMNASIDAAVAAFFGASEHDMEAMESANSEEEEGAHQEGETEAHEEEEHEEGGQEEEEHMEGEHGGG